MPLFRKVSKPKTGYLPVGKGRGPLRFLSGKNEGRPVPTRAMKVTEVVCARCTLPSHKGLPPLVKALGFERKTGKAIEQFVHEKCPSDVPLNKKLIAVFRAQALKMAENAKHLPLPRSRTYNPRAFR